MAVGPRRALDRRRSPSDELVGEMADTVRSRLDDAARLDA